MSLLTKTISPTSKSHTATVFFFHGSGDTGPNLIEWVRFLLGKDMQFPHVKLVFPTAPLQPYTPLGGEESNVWFDRRSIDPSAKESRLSMAAIYERVSHLIAAEVRLGIPLRRILVGGFSMGGALALHTAYHVQPELGGCFALSAFLNRDSIVYESLRARRTSPAGAEDAAPTAPLATLQMWHGDRDQLVRPEWGRQTFEALLELGVRGELTVTKNTMHELKTRQMLQLQDWIGRMLPEVELGAGAGGDGLTGAAQLTNKL